MQQMLFLVSHLLRLLLSSRDYIFILYHLVCMNYEVCILSESDERWGRSAKILAASLYSTLRKVVPEGRVRNVRTQSLQ